MSFDIHILRLHPGDDLRSRLTALPAELGFQAGFIFSGIGSLSRAVIRYAGACEGTYIDGDSEIISLAGTLAAAGGPHVHIAVADAMGAVFGGHLMTGSIVRTTAEIVIGIAADWDLRREADATTGFRELVARRSPT